MTTRQGLTLEEVAYALFDAARFAMETDRMADGEFPWATERLRRLREAVEQGFAAGLLVESERPGYAPTPFQEAILAWARAPRADGYDERERPQEGEGNGNR